MCRRRREEERGGARSEEEVGRSVGRRSVGRSAAGAAPKVRTPHNDVGNKYFFDHPEYLLLGEGEGGGGRRLLLGGSDYLQLSDLHL